MGVARNACRAWRGAIGVAAALGLAASALAAEPIKIGLVAALSGPSAQSGEAITQGLTIAIDEINASGGVLGRPLELVKRDDESSPPKGATAARELIANEKVAAIFGGLDTPVSLAIVPIVNRDHVPYMGVWAAGTPITRNGANPNFAFRVSAVDVLVDEALLKYAQKSGAKKLGLILINNPWGESNEKGLTEQAKHLGITLAGVEKFEDRDVDVVPQLTRLKNAGADALILVANAAPGAQVMKARERMGWKVPVISHWGVSGGRFPELAGPTAVTSSSCRRTASSAIRNRPAGRFCPSSRSNTRSAGPKASSRRLALPMRTTRCIWSRSRSRRRAAPAATRFAGRCSTSTSTRG